MYLSGATGLFLQVKSKVLELERHCILALLIVKLDPTRLIDVRRHATVVAVARRY